MLSLFSSIISSNLEFVGQIPSDDFLCVRFRIFELFQVGFLNPATFTVYEYHRPGNQLDSKISAEDDFAFITVLTASLHFGEAHFPRPLISFILPESPYPPIFSSHFAEGSIVALITLLCRYLCACLSCQAQTEAFIHMSLLANTMFSI